MKTIIVALFGTLLTINAHAYIRTLAQVSFNAVEGRSTFPVVVSLESDGRMVVEKFYQDNPLDRGAFVEENSFEIDADKMQEFISLHEELQRAEIVVAENNVVCIRQPEGLPEDLHISAESATRGQAELSLVHTEAGCWGPVVASPSSERHTGIAKQFKEQLIRLAEQRI